MAVRQKALIVRVHISGAREIIRAFDAMPKEATDELRKRTLRVSEDLRDKVKASALREGAQAALMASTVRANRDRVPSVSAGGNKRVGRHRKPAHKLLFASEFGMNKRSGWYAASRYAESTGRQYNDHIGRHSYWFFKTYEENQQEIARQWLDVADDIVQAWARGGF